MVTLQMTFEDPTRKPPQFGIFVAFHIFVLGERTDFIFGTEIDGMIDLVPAYGRQTVPESGVVSSRDVFYILGALSISQEWLKLELSNFVHG